MNAPLLRRRALAACVALSLATAIPLPALSAGVPQADEAPAPSRASTARRSKGDRKQQAAKAETNYPNATRVEPGLRATEKGGPKLQKLVKAYDAKNLQEARAIADEVIASDKANAYERAFAAQVAAQIAYEESDLPAAETYARRSVEFNGLDNNGHYGTMLMLGQLQLQQEKYAEALATFEKLHGETKAQQPNELYYKGVALYRLQRYPEAISVLRQAIDATPEPKTEWQQLLMSLYAESGMSAEAAQLAEALAKKAPNDKRSQMNLAATYMQSNNYEKAVEVLEKLRAAGQLTEERDYTQLYRLYANIKGKEKETVDVIEEGLQKGILKPDHTTYLALAQSYYFTEQMDKAIEAYTKAAPLAKDGETYLNLAKTLWMANRIPEAKEAARQAKAKGVKKPKDADQIIALPGR